MYLEATFHSISNKNVHPNFSLVVKIFISMIIEEMNWICGYYLTQSETIQWIEVFTK